MKRSFADHFWWRLSDPARRIWPRNGPEPIQRGPGPCTCGRTVEDCDRIRRGEPLTTPDSALVWLALGDVARLLEMVPSEEVKALNAAGYYGGFGVSGGPDASEPHQEWWSVIGYGRSRRVDIARCPTQELAQLVADYFNKVDLSDPEY